MISEINGTGIKNSSFEVEINGMIEFWVRVRVVNLPQNNHD